MRPEIKEKRKKNKLTFCVLDTLEYLIYNGIYGEFRKKMMDVHKYQTIDLLIHWFVHYGFFIRLSNLVELNVRMINCYYRSNFFPNNV